jgi:hypothetical protein
MVYLIGVNHDAQRSSGANLNQCQAELLQCLEIAIVDHRVKIIAVEESTDTLINQISGETEESLPCQIASKHGIDVVFCEPSKLEKIQIGYKDNQQIHLKLFTSHLLVDVPLSEQQAAVYAVEIAVIFPRREDFWISKMKNYLHLNVVCVIGEDHIESFGLRLRQKGVVNEVLCHGIGVADAQKIRFENAKTFQSKCPELFTAMTQAIESA